ncbi:MAG: hypothetical protein GXY51_12745 [Bacteroidetes bacterium]|nr:hypothetical protein [Bacteroidota bacterium]
MFKKILTYFKSGGLKEVVTYGWTYVRKIVYYKSETIFFYLEKKDFNKQPYKNSEIKFKIVQKLEDIEEINFNRLKTVDYKKWISRDSYAIVGYLDSKPVSFTWTHLRFIPTFGMCPIKHAKGMSWTGPSFVDKSVRNQGINIAQKSFQIEHSPTDINYFITSARKANIPSIRALNRVGYKVGLIMIKYYGLFSNRKTVLKYENEGKLLFQFIS